MYAKKSLGQHFLNSAKALESIIEAGTVGERNLIVEIGPGRGVLTEKLLDANAQVIGVEKDDNLFEFLKAKFEREIASHQLTLAHADILDFDLSQFHRRPYKLIANIPYNITGAILEKFLSADEQPESIVLLVQKEVAKRITDPEKESILSLSVKVYGTPRYVETVKAGSFVPAPKVDSAIIAINRISKKFFAEFEEKEFFRMLQVGFQSKRKKLSSNLAVIFDKKKVQNAFERFNLDENLRAEDAKLEIWQKLAQNLV